MLYGRKYTGAEASPKQDGDQIDPRYLNFCFADTASIIFLLCDSKSMLNKGKNQVYSFHLVTNQFFWFLST
jgi:hypothetical protein